MLASLSSRLIPTGPFPRPYHSDLHLHTRIDVPSVVLTTKRDGGSPHYARPKSPTHVVNSIHLIRNRSFQVLRFTPFRVSIGPSQISVTSSSLVSGESLA